MVIEENKPSHLDENQTNNHETMINEGNEIQQDIKETIAKNKELIEKTREILRK